MTTELIASTDKYKSLSQIAKDLTETWVAKNSYCPNCGQKQIERFAAGRPVADFFCRNCDEQFELKSKASAFSKKVTDGAFATMIQRLRAADNPNFLFLSYLRQPPQVRDYFVVPKHFFVPEIIIKRNPSTVKGRAKPWIGCDINLGKVPESGKVFVVKGGREVSKKEVLGKWKRTLFLKDEAPQKKGWTLDVMRCVESIRKDSFSLDDVYSFEKALSKLHPENKHVHEKIRQQLQILRDHHYLVFEGRGKYRLRK